MIKPIYSLSLFLLLSGCVVSQPPHVPSYEMQPKIAENGYYKYLSYWYSGKLKDNMPHGKGKCKTFYQVSKYKSEAIFDNCDFKDGIRVDKAHQARIKSSLAFEQQRRAEELKSEKLQQAEYAEAQRQSRMEEERSRRATEAAFASSILNASAQIVAENQKMLDQQRRFNQSIANANRAAELSRQSTRPSHSTASTVSTSTQSNNTSATTSTASTRVTHAKNSNSTAPLQKQREEQAKAQRLELEKQREQAKAKLEQERLAAQAKAKLEEERLAAQAKREQAKQEAEEAKRRKVAEDAQARTNFLDKVKTGTRFSARTCIGGEGDYYVVGIRPRPKPEIVSCVDVHFKAQCRGGGAVVNGVADNFLGMSTSCFMGDTYRLRSKLNCPPEDVVVTAVSAKPCGQ